MIKRLLVEYTNGNYTVQILNDGTKIRKTEDDEFNPELPESMDLKITSYCDMNCPQCHENSSTKGKHASLSLPFFNTLPKGMELAIGGGNPLEHPDLIPFLKRMKKQGVICNITINQRHLEKNIDLVQKLINEELVYGVGVSYVDANDELFQFCKKNKNTIIHLILGIHSLDVLDKLANKGLKILFLGYKKFGRGENYYNNEIDIKTEEVNKCFNQYKDKFTVICLDGKAYDDLKIKKRITKEEYEKYYMGDEGCFTMYVDAVEEQYAISSVAKKRKPITDNIKDMFEDVRRNRNEN